MGAAWSLREKKESRGRARTGTVTMQVAVALICRQDRLLVCQRRDSGAFPLKWEFPGGKVETGEGYSSALRRELKEELGIEVQSATEVYRHSHLYPDGTEVELVFFRVDDYRGRVENHVFRRILWVEISGLQELDFLEGDLPIIEKIMRRELAS
jgi:8-oxo-dGTP diphosphatase